MTRLLLTCLLAFPAAGVAQPAEYQLDPVHTRVLFAVSHAGFSYALGTVSGSTGTMVFDPDDWSTARVSVSVPMARLDLGDAEWNHAVGARSLLDVSGHPVATFVSGRVVPKDAQHASVCGTLTLRGVGQDVCLEVTFHQVKRLSLPPFHRIAGFSATTTLSRKAFGIDAWSTVIGDEVQLRIEAEAIPGVAPQAPAADGHATTTATPEAPPPAATQPPVLQPPEMQPQAPATQPPATPPPAADPTPEHP